MQIPIQYFLLLLGLIVAAPSARAEVQMPVGGCDTIITANGQELLVTVVRQNVFTIYYRACDGNNDKIRRIRREDVRLLKRVSPEFRPPAHGVPKEAVKLYSDYIKMRRSAISVLIFGYLGGTLSVLVYSLGVFIVTSGFIWFLAVIALGLMLTAIIMGSHFLSKTRFGKEAFVVERLMVIAGMVLAMSLVAVAVMFLVVALFALIIFLLF